MYNGPSQLGLEPNAYTLFLIFILLVLGTNNDFDERINRFSNILKTGHNAVKIMRSGMNEFRAMMQYSE